MTALTQKELIVTITVTLLSAVVFGMLAVLLPQAIAGNWTVAVVLLLLALLWVASMAVALTLGRRLWSVVALCTLPPLTMTAVTGFSPVASGGAILLVLFTLMADRTQLRDEQNRLYYRTTHFFTGTVRLLALGLMVGVVSLAWPAIEDSVRASRFSIQPRHVEPFLKPLEPTLRNYFPGYEPGANIDQLIEAQILEEQKKLPPGFTFSEEQKEEIRTDARARLGSDVTGTESLSTIVSQRMDREVRQLAQQNPLRASVILAVLAFLVLRTILPIITLPTLGVVAALVYILTHTPLAVIQKEPAQVERLRLS